MISLLAHQLADMGISDGEAKARVLAEKCSLRLLMVAYSYSNVLKDLHDEYLAN